jgi:hypothetical protein
MPMRLVTLLLTLAMGFGGLGVGAFGTDSAAAHSSVQQKTKPALTAGVTMTIAPQNSNGSGGSGILRPGEDLVLSGIISNGTSAAIPAGVATVFLNRSISGSRDDLADWLNTDSDKDDSKLGSQVFDATTPDIPAGESRQLSLIVPAASIGLGSGTATWGARQLAVLVSTATGEVARAHSAIVWFPGVSFQPTKLAVVMPITLPENTTGLISSDDLVSYTGPTGILTHQLREAIDQQIAIAVDPMIVASIRILGNTAPQTAKDWLARLETATNETFPLSYADSDISALSQASSDPALAPISFAIDPKRFPTVPPTTTPTPTGTPTTTPSPSPSSTLPPTNDVPTSANLASMDYTIKNLAWPLEGSVVSKDLSNFAAKGLATTILSSTNASYGKVGYTPSASVTIDKHPAVIADATISKLFRQAVFAPTLAEWQESVAELSASLAVITRERSGEARTMLASLGRGYPTSNFRLSATLEALNTLPWTATTTLSNVLATPPVEATMVDQPQPATRVTQVETLMTSDAQVGSFSSVLEDPTLVTGPHRLSLLATLSNAWIGNPSGWSGYAQYLKSSKKLIGSVGLAGSGSIFQPADRIPIPVTVRNDLDFPVTVIISVRSPSGVLNVVDKKVTLTVEANSQQRGAVRVRSLANGDVTLAISLTSPTGVSIGQPNYVNVSVQAGWETAITVVFAALLVLIFGFGIYRNISKRRRAARRADAASSGPGESDDPGAGSAVADSEVAASEPQDETPRD